MLRAARQHEGTVRRAFAARRKIEQLEVLEVGDEIRFPHVEPRDRAAIDRQMLGITAATVVVILLLLLIAYRSPVGAAIPLISVGVALAVARPIVAALGDAGVVEVSLFSVALLAAMMLGAGTDYAIFLIGRYHEGRRRGIPRAGSLVTPTVVLPR